MLCIGYGEARAGEGSLSADADPSSVALLTVFASRHLLPQGEKEEGRSATRWFDLKFLLRTRGIQCRNFRLRADYPRHINCPGRTGR